ncbi:MAG: hypothetical protein G01um10142_78 [Parcubacteria group bacterium Gr01-1014_2]|nr:MAG: hypothetical protein G01um10142_78 [Parcubacteria group bacterium Gr01-1014_2]
MLWVRKSIYLKKTITNMPEVSAKQFVEIQEIRDNILILKDGSLRQIMKVGSINFELKSQDEQLAILQGFRNFLNALDFSLEIMVMSRKLNISGYLAFIDSLIENQQNELMRIQAVDYSKFVKELTQLANIMDKEFFVVVPYYLGPRASKGISNALKSFFKPSEIFKKLTPEEFDAYKLQLNQRVNLMFENLFGLGLTPKVMERDELINLYYRFYNPEAVV